MAQDKRNQKYQAFIRGEAITVLNNCTDFWNGTEVIPIIDKLRSDIKALVKQWEADDFDSIGFSYKPVTEDFEAEIKNCLIIKQRYSKSLAN